MTDVAKPQGLSALGTACAFIVGTTCVLRACAAWGNSPGLHYRSQCYCAIFDKAVKVARESGEVSGWRFTGAIQGDAP